MKKLNTQTDKKKYFIISNIEEEKKIISNRKEDMQICNKCTEEGSPASLSSSKEFKVTPP